MRLEISKLSSYILYNFTKLLTACLLTFANSVFLLSWNRDFIRETKPRFSKILSVMLLCHLWPLSLQVRWLLASVSDVVITRDFAWNPRCVVIICVNSVERSTFDISNSPDVILLPSAVISSPIPSNSPEFKVVLQQFSPTFSRPAALANCATAICPNRLRLPLS